MRLRFGRQALATALLLALAVSPAAAYVPPKPDSGVADVAAPEPDEAAVLQELFTLGRDLERTREAIAGLDEQRLALERQIAGARTERDRLAALRRERQAQLGRRLRVWREQGQVALVGALVSARSLENFLTRLEWVRMILDRDSRLIREVRGLQDAVAVQERTLQAAEAELAGARAALAADERKLGAAIAEREALLVSLRDRRTEVEAQLQDIERVWAEKARPVLESLGATLLTVDPADFQPDSIAVSLFPPGATATITEEGLARFFSRTPALRDLTFHIGTEFATMQGQFEGAPVKIAGKFQVVGKSVLRFEPRVVRIRDFDVPAQALQELPGQGQVEIDVGVMINPWALKDVTMREGELQIRAGLK
jgi:hypothetical protein